VTDIPQSRSVADTSPGLMRADRRCRAILTLGTVLLAVVLTPGCFLWPFHRHKVTASAPATAPEAEPAAPEAAPPATAPATPPATKPAPTSATTPPPAEAPTQTETAPAPAATPSSEPQPSPTGSLAFEQIQFSHSHLGTVIIADTGIGYAFTEHFSADFGLPIFFTRSPFSPVSTRDYQWYALFGAPYLDVRYTNVHHNLKYTSVLTGTIPVSNEDQIYTTGRPGVDLYTHVEGTGGGFAGVKPFLNFGVSNGAIDRFSMPRPYTEARPYETLGALADGELGAEYKVGSGPAKGVAIGASMYGLRPVGPQKVFSRLVVPYSSLAGDGQHYRYWDASFETNMPIEIAGAQELTGQSGSFDGCVVANNVVTCKALSSIARDNGYSGWIEIPLPRLRFASLQLGYVHSIHYALDTYTVTLNFDARSLLRNFITGR